MSTELKFEIVPDTIRDTLARIPRNERSPLYVKLIGGETVFIPHTDDLKEGMLNKFYEKARSVGKRLNKRKTVVDGRIGFVMWFSDQENI